MHACALQSHKMLQITPSTPMHSMFLTWPHNGHICMLHSLVLAQLCNQLHFLGPWLQGHFKTLVALGRLFALIGELHYPIMVGSSVSATASTISLTPDTSLLRQSSVTYSSRNSSLLELQKRRWELVLCSSAQTLQDQRGAQYAV